MIKNANAYIVAMAAVTLVGCTSYLADKHFRSPAEVSAMNSANWVPMFTNAQGKAVNYDPYRMKWVNNNTFTVPVSFPMSTGNYGAWVIELNCNNNTVTTLRTLGSTVESRNNVSQAAPDSILATVRDRICGIRGGSKNFSYISSDANGNAYYYDQNNLARSVKNQNTYRFDWILFDIKAKRNLVEKTSEVNCSDKTFRLSAESQWQSTKFLSTENIFIARFCPSIIARRPFFNTYSSLSGDISTDDYLKKLNSDGSKPASAKQRSDDKPQGSAKSGFEWDKLVIHPKD